MHINEEMTGFVIGLLKNKVPDTYYYHNYEHSLYVMEKTIEIGKHENCSEKEIYLLSTAGLWHDIGYINIYYGHEEESCKLVRKYLPGYGYPDDDIDSICGMIMATKIPQTPKTKLEKIVADADMEYLGTKDAARQANNLFRELSALDPTLTKEAWDKTEISFLKKHNFFTAFCKKHREPLKKEYLDSLLNKF